jgi:hypothetical protein
VPAKKLALGEVLSESFGFFFGNVALFFHLVTIPWILSLVLRVAGSALGDDTPLSALAEKAIDLIPTVMFMVAWIRVSLFGANRAGPAPGLSWSRRETAFLIHLIKVAGITFLLIAAFTFVVGSIDPSSFSGPVDPDVARREALAAPLGTGFVISGLMALRVCFGLAASAVDVPFTPRESWAYSRGNAWTIIGAMFVILFTSGIVTTVAALVPLSILRSFAVDSAAAIVTWTVAILVSYAGSAVACTAQAIIFRRLTGWRDGQPLAPPS